MSSSHPNSTPSVPASPSTGRWTASEHSAFLTGLTLYGRDWKLVSTLIPTRTSAQIRSHAQKYFAKVGVGGEGDEGERGVLRKAHTHMKHSSA